MDRKHLGVERVDGAAWILLATASVSWSTLVVALLGQLTSPWLLLPGVIGFAAFLAWFSRSYANLWAVSAGQELTWSPRWAVGAWVLPGLNLVLPIVLTADVWRVAHRKVNRQVSNGLPVTIAVAALAAVTVWCGWKQVVAPTLVLATVLFALGGYYVVTVSRLQGELWRLTWEERVRRAGQRARSTEPAR